MILRIEVMDSPRLWERMEREERVWVDVSRCWWGGCLRRRIVDEIAMRHAQKTAMMAPAPILSSLTSLEPNQKHCTNMGHDGDELRRGTSGAPDRVEHL
jgi:hypothetical protein